MDLTTPRGGWALFVQVAIAFLVTICLSIWQVSRGMEKRELAAEYQARLNKPPIDATQWRDQNSDYRRIEIRGSFDLTRAFVIENKYHQGAAGYWIIGVFNSADGRFLANRGWVPIEANTFVNPVFETGSDTLQIQGVLWPNESTRSGPRVDLTSWPVRLRTMDVVEMAIVTGANAKEVRLVDRSPGVFQPVPLNIQFSAVRHWSYAFQWLFIGCLVLLGYWYFVINRQRPGDSEK